MAADIRRSIVALLALTVALGGLYPVAVWAVGRVAFNDRATGSLVKRDGTVVGSSLLAQAFASDRYFHPRPSAADYNASGSAASNLGPNSQDLSDTVRKNLDDAAKANGV